ncbi:MAG: hypothetical protein A2Y07_09935 [Planctomycetes bacterium GWF2_50_10]|nr:MAG: hypothetical protein A2Y07_09935 [Planctomycetes bacterium GWF2_50_10]
MADEKKIIIDEDWKNQAQKEKEKLVEEQAKHEQEKSAPRLPPASMSGLISMLATQALYAMGIIGEEAEKDNPREPDLEMAKFNIEMLSMLEEKTKGNLSAEEAEMMKGALYQLRMAFVQMSGGKTS